MNVLSVAEKPSVAKELAAIIGKVPPETIRRQGVSPYNPIFRIERCPFKDSQVQMTMTSVAGHMMELEFDEKFRQWSSCSPIELFSARLNKTVKKESEAIQQTLINESKKCQVLLLWLDCDLEGENIAFEVIQVCLKANPNLDVYRARFSALIERDIFRTLRQPDRPNRNMTDAVDTRQEIDLRIGAAFTRFQTLRLQKRFQDITSVVSYGPCQFPTLGFVVERDLAIKRFQPQKFWYISCEGEFPNPDNPNKGNVTVRFNWERVRLYDQLSAFLLYETCFDGDNGSGRARVLSCSSNPSSRWRPVPMNTIEYQILASRHLHLSSEKAMAIAENLYQRGIVSYPRTETNFFKEGFELNAILQDFVNHSEFGAYTNHLLNNQGFLWPRDGKKDDQAHPPVHPTKSVELNQLQDEDGRKVYDLIVRHFLAACSKDAKGNTTTVKIRIPAGPSLNQTKNIDSSSSCFEESKGFEDGNEDSSSIITPQNNENAHYEIFSASGLMVLERNYLDIYSKFDYWNAVKIPVFQIGDTFVPKTLLLVDGETSPPTPISESELISVMDKNGIGTDATIATHISTIQQREYVIKDQRNCFKPTPLGLALVEGYNSMGYQLNKPFLRAAIESDCAKVARGEMRKEEALTKCLSTMKQCFTTCLKEVTKLDQAVAKYFQVIGSNPGSFQILQRNFTSCGKCQGLMDLRMENEPENNNNNNNNRGERKKYLFCHPCKQSYLLPSRGDFYPQTEKHCPICQFNPLLIKNPETNKEYYLCPYCFNNPPDIKDGGIENLFHDFRCFQCANKDCELSGRLLGSDINISKCSNFIQCKGYYRLKKSNKQGYYLACCSSQQNCNKLWFLPKFVKSVIPQENQACSLCLQRYQLNILKLTLEINLSKAPRGLDPEMTICPFCDPLWERIDVPPLPLKSLIVQQQPPPQQQFQQQQGTNYTPRHGVAAMQVPTPVQQYPPAPVTTPYQQPPNFLTPQQQQVQYPGYPVYPQQTTTTSMAYQSASTMMPPPFSASSLMSPPSINVHPSLPSRTANLSSLLTSSASSSMVIEIDDDVDDNNAYNMALHGKSSSSKYNSSSASRAKKTNNNYSSNSSNNYNNSMANPPLPPMMDVPMCGCNKPAKSLTVNKESANKGRPFFSCAE